MKILGGKVQDVVKFPLMDTDMDRSFVVIKKMKPTGQEVPQEGWLAGEGTAGVEYVLILR